MQDKIQKQISKESKSVVVEIELTAKINDMDRLLVIKMNTKVEHRK
jgi:hypothetical protein